MSDVIKKLINHDDIYDTYQQIIVMGSLLGYRIKVLQNGHELIHDFITTEKMFRIDFTFDVNFTRAEFSIVSLNIKAKDSGFRTNNYKTKESMVVGLKKLLEDM